MTVAFTPTKRDDVGLSQIISGRLALDNSYPAGGYPITAREMGFRVGAELTAVTGSGSGGYGYEYVRDAILKDRGQLFITQTGPAVDGPFGELPDTTDLSGIVLELAMHGR